MQRHMTMRRAAAIFGTIVLGLVPSPAQGQRVPVSKDPPPATKAAPAVDGRVVFSSTCAACHQASGEGVPGTYPPLAGSGWVTGDPHRLVRVILHGLTGEIDVEGETYSGMMPPWGGSLGDAEIAAVATYVRTSFGNRASPVTAETVARIRRETASRNGPWTEQELKRAASGNP